MPERPAGGLHVAEDLTLPQQAVTAVTAILAKRGAGKTYAAAVCIEEMVTVGAPVVILDPIGAWWGLRSSADGHAEGLPFTILGGDHGDLPLEPTAGRVIADLVARQPVLLILDMTGFDSDAAQQRFVTDFCDQLYRANRRPLHLVLEEADEFAPQSPMRDQTVMVNKVQRLARRGRQRGIGLTLICQRSAALHKGVLTQADILIAGRTTADLDQRAIETWIANKQVEEQRAEVMGSLHDLPTTDKWVWAPELGILQRVRVRPRRTFDSSATPELGAVLEAPQVLAPVDLEALRGQMAEVVAKAEQDDPKALRRRIADLERKLAVNERSAPDSARVADLERQLHEALARSPVREEVPVIPPGDVAALDQIVTAMRETADRVELALRSAQKTVTPRAEAPRPIPVQQATVKSQRRPVQPPPAPTGDVEGPVKLSRAERAILAVLAQFPPGRTKQQVATLSGYSVKSSSLANALGSLRSAGYATRGDPIQATAEGVAALGDDWEPLPEGAALVGHWMGKLGKAEQAVLRVMLEAWPAELTREEVAERSGYSATSSSLANALGKLRTLQLVKGWVADETLAQHARER
jgi:uncharacterized protein